ncbi:hypothetical protein M426DRAFT_324012 [Hypoxylon sp. CI-4A]|nr:hypothetical protein M426DRAFT_324012 [Hypoxylon sp. CI-4A]
MRSRPYTPPPPLPPLLTELSAYLPNRGRDLRGSGSSDAEVALSDLDPETSRLLSSPPPRKRALHRVRVQGRLAAVRSVSVADSRSASCGAPETRFDAAAGAVGGGNGGGGGRRRRRRSEDDLIDGDGGEGEVVDDDDDDGETEERDAQMRGYGIGGRGNIRRPTEVIGTSSKSSLSISSLFSSSSLAPPRSPSGPGQDKRWSIAGLLNRIEERRGRERSI